MKELVTEFAKALVEVLGNSLTMNDALNFYGRCFIRSFDRYGYDKIIKVSNTRFIVYTLSVYYYTCTIYSGIILTVSI